MAVWSTAFVNDLPDSSFMFIEPGGTKDDTGRTTPRSKRKLPYKDAAGKVDMPHLRNAIARIPQIAGISNTTKDQLQERARRILDAENEKRGLSFAAPVGVMQRAGQRKWVKDVIHTGHFKHPSGAFAIDVDPARQDKWVETFFRMQENGVKVPIFSDHEDDTPNQRKNPTERTKGYLTDMFRSGDSLYVVQEFTTPESETLANTVGQVSINVDPDFVDGEGHEYGEAITHVALTPKPVVPGQRAFVPLSMIRTEDKETEDMEKLLQELQKAFSLGDDVTEENVIERLTAERTKLAEQLADMQKARDKIQASLDAKPKDKTAVDIPAEVLDVMTEANDAKLDQLVSLSMITPAVRDKLAAIFAHEKAQTFMLSRTASGTEKSVSSLILDALKENNVVDLKPKTGPQTMTLSRENVDEEAKGAAEAIKEMLEMAG